MLRVLLAASLVALTAGDFNLLLLHTNDMHARFQQADRYQGMCEDDSSTACYGGFARVHAVATQKRQEAEAKGRSSIFLNAGDTYQGTPYYTYFKWPIVARFINMLGLDVLSLGNHEFDDGIAGLVPFIKKSNVPFVCANLNTSLTPSMDQPNLNPSYVLDVNGTKIGVIGYLTPDTVHLSNTGALQILAEIPSIQTEAVKLASEGINIIIALGHSGYQMDQEIAKAVPEVDLVVGGHSHTFLYTGTPPDIEVPAGLYPTVVTQASGKQVPVVQAFYATKYLGYLELDFDDNGNLKNWTGQPILLNGSLPQDPDILSALRPYEQNISAEVHRVLGYTHVLLDDEQAKCKLGECNMGNLITDAYVDYVTKNYKNPAGWTIASIAINQAGGIRASINTETNEYHNGSITLGDVITAVPWGQNIAVLTTTGQTILEALEFSVHRYEETLTGHVSEFLQVSGLQVVYNMGLPSGHRVVSVDVLCASCDVPMYQPLNLNTTYGVVLPEYLANGGDSFQMFQNDTERIILSDVDYEIIAQYIQSHTPIYPAVEGRITIGNHTNHTTSGGLRTQSSTTLIAALLAAYLIMLLLVS